VVVVGTKQCQVASVSVAIQTRIRPNRSQSIRVLQNDASILFAVLRTDVTTTTPDSNSHHITLLILAHRHPLTNGRTLVYQKEQDRNKRKGQGLIARPSLVLPLVPLCRRLRLHRELVSTSSPASSASLAVLRLRDFSITSSGGKRKGRTHLLSPHTAMSI